jgi:hypothetical protein
MERSRGFSLIELLLAMGVTMTLAAMTFHLFHHNERVVRDQTLIMEMQQTARIVASQIADEIRMAGQGVPVYASRLDATPTEAAAVFLSSSNASRIDFRAGLSNVETAAAGGASDFTLGMTRTLGVASGTGFLAGRFAYVIGPSSGGAWTWLRAEVTGVASTTLTLTPRNNGTGASSVHFASFPSVAQEEAISIYLSGGSIRRATATDFTNAAAPLWSAANEIGRHCTGLVFTYYDAAGNALTPTSLPNRLAIARVDVSVTVQTASPLSNGSRPRYSLAVRTIPRNVRL